MAWLHWLFMQLNRFNIAIRSVVVRFCAVDGAVGPDNPDTVHEVPPAASEDPEAVPHSPESASKEDLKATEEGP